jgi:hypothetical protein
LEITDDCEVHIFEYFSREIEKNNYDSLRKLQQQYKDFQFLDEQLFPLEAFAGFAERDVIETVRGELIIDVDQMIVEGEGNRGGDKRAAGAREKFPKGRRRW